MEQDNAKTILDKDGRILIDYNRAGMPLLEIVTEPQYTNPEDCQLVVKEMQEMLNTLGVSMADISQSTMRVDVNVSVHDSTSLLETPKIEIKSLCSTKNVEQAIEYEYRRLVAILEAGEEAQYETRRYLPDQGITKLLRSNPEKPDYRYF